MDESSSEVSDSYANGHTCTTVPVVNREEISNKSKDLNLDQDLTSSSKQDANIYQDSLLSETDPSYSSAEQQQNSEDDGEDEMPDLIWSDKKCNGSSVKPSESKDTGFSSDTPTSSPGGEEDQKTIENTLNNGDDADDEKNVMDILGNGLLIKKILEAGRGEGTRPNNGDSVTIRVDGVLEDGTHVDVQDFTFILGDGDVIVAFDIAVALMEADEKSEVKTAPRYAYDELGREPDIPKDATIIYTIELVDVKPAVSPSSLSFEERLLMGDNKRERGNYLYSRQDFSGAINSYGKAVKLLDDEELNGGLEEASRSSLSECWVKCYNNMAACQLKISAYDAAIRSCEKVLAVQENNVKALFRLGKAYGSKNEVDEALMYLKRAIKLDPESKMLHQEVLVLSRRKTQETHSERELYQRMLGVKPGDGPVVKETVSNPLKRWMVLAGGVAAVLASMGMAYYRMA